MSVGLFIWILLNGLLYPVIVNLVIENGFPVFVTHIYFFSLYMLLGAFIGWFGGSKGWLLSFIFGVVISILFIFVSLVGNFLEIELKHFGYFKTSIKLIVTQILFILYLVIGSILGFKLNYLVKKHNKGMGVTH